MNSKEILYSILKEIKEGNNINSEVYGITDEEFGVIIEHALQKKYIENAYVNRNGKGNKVDEIVICKARITFKGEIYLDENSSLSKT